MKKTCIREASLDDLSFLEQLESHCFPIHRRNNRRSLRTSIMSPSQRVLILQLKEREIRLNIGAAVLFCHKHSLRIYSIAILPAYQSQGLGNLFIKHISALSRQHGCRRVTLEADSQNTELVFWYQKNGFEITEILPDYYAVNEPAVRMVKALHRNGNNAPDRKIPQASSNKCRLTQGVDNNDDSTQNQNNQQNN